MFGLEHQHTAAVFVRGPEARRAEHGDVVCFGRAGGEDDLPRLGADGSGNLLPRRLNAVGCGQTPLVFDRGRVTEAFCPQRLHDFCNLR